ncbi:hypothetical protein TNCV_869201 [Trichonephila clavipes]|nr:hypothetical protein TNCV_869201 [Trichonephila clavipes]
MWFCIILLKDDVWKALKIGHNQWTTPIPISNASRQREISWEPPDTYIACRTGIRPKRRHYDTPVSSFVIPRTSRLFLCWIVKRSRSNGPHAGSPRCCKRPTVGGFPDLAHGNTKNEIARRKTATHSLWFS